MFKIHIFPLLVALALVATLGMAGATEGPADQVDTQAIARRIEELTNEARARNGLGPAVHVEYLAVAATRHSDEMARLGYFSHSSPSAELSTPKKRIIRAGGWDTETGENIYRCSGSSAEDVAQRAVSAWLASPGHYKNIMNPNYNSMGVGVVGGGNTFTITQDFSKQAIAVIESTVRANGQSIELILHGRVRLGSMQGALFVDGRLQGTFEGDSKGEFRARLTAHPGAVISVGQQTASRRYTITLLLPPLGSSVLGTK